MINSMLLVMKSKLVMKLTGTRGQTRHDLRPDLAMFDIEELEAYTEAKESEGEEKKKKERVCALARRFPM